MARPRRDPNSVDTPERILAAAEVEFAREGFERARLADIAKAAGIRRPSLLYHFDSKERLYEAVVQRSIARLGTALVTGRSLDGTFAQRLRGMVESFAAFVEADPTVAPLIVHELVGRAAPGQAILSAVVAPVLDEVVRWIETEGGEGLRDGVPVRAAVLHIASDALLRNAAGELRSTLWGGVHPEDSWTLARAMLLEEAP